MPINAIDRDKRESFVYRGIKYRTVNIIVMLTSVVSTIYLYNILYCNKYIVTILSVQNIYIYIIILMSH